MKLSTKAIKILQKKENTKVRNRLAYDLNAHITTIERWIEKNEDNGNLTTLASLNAITEETGLTQKEALQ